MNENENEPVKCAMCRKVISAERVAESLRGYKTPVCHTCRGDIVRYGCD